MSEEKRNNQTEQDDIGKILEQYKMAKENAQKRENLVEPPKHYSNNEKSEDNSKETTSSQKEAPKKAVKKPSVKSKKSKDDYSVQTIESIRQKTIDDKNSKDKKKNSQKAHQKKNSIENEIKKTNRKKSRNISTEKFKSFWHSRAGKIFVTAFCVGIIIALIIFGIIFAVNKNKNSYLTPYEQKYGISMPNGMLEEYCDEYAKNTSMVAKLKVNSISYPLSTNDSNDTYLDSGCDTQSIPNNAVIYTTSSAMPQLESSYNTADAYNDSEHYIEYGTLYEKHNYRIIGAYYTSTVAEDDNDYIFPYNVTGDMTSSSFYLYADSVNTRLLYNTEYTITKGDKLLTLCVDTPYHINFKFVVVAVLQDKKNNDIVATKNQNPRYPQIIYDEKNQLNPYQLAKKWYPEITISGKKVQQTIEDYR